MRYTILGMGIGAFLAAMIFAFGFWGFLVAIIFMAIGGVIGRAAEGRIDLRGAINALLGRRSSS